LYFCAESWDGRYFAAMMGVETYIYRLKMRFPENVAQPLASLHYGDIRNTMRGCRIVMIFLWVIVFLHISLSQSIVPWSNF